MMTAEIKGICKNCGEVKLGDAPDFTKIIEKITELNSSADFAYYPCPVCDGPIYEILPIEFNKEP